MDNLLDLGRDDEFTPIDLDNITITINDKLFVTITQEITQKVPRIHSKRYKNSLKSSKKSLKKLQQITQKVPRIHSKSPMKSLKKFQEITKKVPRIHSKRYKNSLKKSQEITQEVLQVLQWKL